MKRIIAREWLWLVACIAGAAAIVLPSDRPGEPFILYGLIFYPIVGAVRLTVWAIRTALFEPKKPA